MYKVLELNPEDMRKLTTTEEITNFIDNLIKNSLN